MLTTSTKDKALTRAQATEALFEKWLLDLSMTSKSPGLPISSNTSVSSSLLNLRHGLGIQARKSTGGKPPRKRSREDNDQGSFKGSSCLLNTSRNAAGTASLCSEFAVWLEGLGESAMDKFIIEAVERDGGKFFHLIRCTLDYERALEGLGEHLDMRTEPSGPIGHRAKALRDFADFLDAKAQDDMSIPLSLAIDRDGKQLFRLAKRCLSFNKAINGEGEGSESP